MKALEEIADAVSGVEARTGRQVERIELGSFFWSVLREELQEERKRANEVLRGVVLVDPSAPQLPPIPEHLPEHSLLFGIPVEERSDLAEGFRLR